jgi:hypothetical protein
MATKNDTTTEQKAPPPAPDGATKLQQYYQSKPHAQPNTAWLEKRAGYQKSGK